MTGIVVRKYGGSVLDGDAAFRRAARSIARSVRDGRSVVAVVSAVRGVTDALVDRALAMTDAPEPAARDLLLATGELQSVALLALALAADGVPAVARNPWQLGLHTDGVCGDSRLRRVNPLPIRVALADARVVVVPGFVGRADDDTLTTLGRGGSDLTAMAIADALDAEACEFWKDVPGLFSADPDVIPGAMHRECVSVEEALELARFGCRLLQDRAIERAASVRCPVVIRSLGDERATVFVRKIANPCDPSSVVAITHLREPASVSLVGSRVGDDPAFAEKARRLLEATGVPATIASRSGCRLTLSVPAHRVEAALRRLHDHFVHHAASQPNRDRSRELASPLDREPSRKD